MAKINEYFKDFNAKKWFDLNKGLSAKDIKKNGSETEIIGIEELMDFLIELKEGSAEYAVLDKRQALFPMKYYIDYDFPSEAFITLANTINIPYFTRKERVEQGSPQKLFIEKYFDYCLSAEEKIKSSAHYSFDTEHFNDYFCTRGFKYMKSTSTHAIISENHILRGWLLFSILTKLSEKGLYCMEYSSAGGNFYMRVPSTSTRSKDLDEILNGKERKDVVTMNYATEEKGLKGLEEWHLLHAKVEDKGEIYRGKRTRYKIPEEFLDHRIIATMISRQFVYKILNKEENLKPEDFTIRDYAEKPKELKKVIYNIIPMPDREAIALYSKIINRVVVKGRENPKLSIREIESLFSAANKNIFLKNKNIYLQNNSYENLVLHRDMILEEFLKWVLE
ncbi:MAG: hypothetical protein ACP5OZ_02535 [Candidatus Woesearchaeota archaeon]